MVSADTTASTKASDAQRRRRWRAWIRRLEPEIATLVISAVIYRQLQESLRTSSLGQTRGDFYGLIAHNYLVTTTIAIRKQTDPQKRSVSLARLLEDIAAHPNAITRHSHRMRYPSASGRRHARGTRHPADVVFDALVGKDRETLPLTRVQREVRQLQLADRSIRIFVNKRVAHLDRRNRGRTVPTFGELDAAIRLIELPFMNYRHLLTGQARGSGIPVFSLGDRPTSGP